MLGADGETARQLAKLIGFDSDPEKCLTLLKEELATFAELPSVSQSAGAFVNHEMSLKETYLNETQKHLGCLADSIDVSQPPDAAAKINKWVSDQTQGKIDDIIKASMINANTLAVLMSTTLFKGLWKEEFKSTDSVDTFHTAKDESIKVPFMQLSKKNHFSVFVEDDLSVIKIPYKDEMQMTLVMPPLGHMSTFEAEFKNDGYFRDLLAKCHTPRGEVQLTMPKFKISSEMDLKQVFTKLGHGKLFDVSVNHDYSKMATGPVAISDAVHQATVEVDEKGTVAAAATSVAMMLRCAPAEPVIIQVDSPFLFFIHRDDKVLFTGRIVQP